MFLYVIIGLMVLDIPVELEPPRALMAPPIMYCPSETLPTAFFDVSGLDCADEISPEIAACTLSSTDVSAILGLSNVATGSSISFIASLTSANTPYQIPSVAHPPSFMVLSNWSLIADMFDVPLAEAVMVAS